MNQKRFRIPEDLWIFDALSSINPDYIVGGSVGQHLIVSPGEPASFKDLDLCVGPGFMDSAMGLYPGLRKIVESGASPDTAFDEAGMLSSRPRSRHVENGVEYLAKIWIRLGGVYIDTFVCDLKRIPREPVEISGVKVNAVEPEHAVKMLESMLGSELAKNKKPSVEERIARLKRLISDRRR
jgi:hypothetical protein